MGKFVKGDVVIIPFPFTDWAGKLKKAKIDKAIDKLFEIFKGE